VKVLKSPRTRWYLLAALWLLLLVIGIGGFLQQSHDGDLDRSFLDTLYLTLQLVTLDYGGGDDHLNWRLQVARFVAPIMAAGTVLQTASLVFAEQFRRARLRFASGHTVVCGLGEVGGRLAEAFVAAGDDVVAIEGDASAPGVAAAREAGATVLQSDATAAALATARVGRASRLICVTGDDARNVAVALTATSLPRQRPTALRVSVQLTDAELSALLRANDLDGSGSTRTAFFNLHERAASAWLGEHPPFTTPAPHALVCGLGQLGRSLVVALAKAWAGQGHDEPLRITLLDRVAGGRWRSLTMQHPALDTVCAATTIDLDLDEPDADAMHALRATLAEHPPTWTAVAFEDESVALSTALFFEAHVAAGSPLVVRTGTREGLGALLRPAAGRHVNAALGVFPFLDRTCTVAAIDGTAREQLARAVHEQYLADTPSNGSALARPWDELADDDRDLSRRRVDGILADVESLGRALVPLRRWSAVDDGLAVADVDALARREHERWRADRVAAGWTYGAVRDDALRHNPLLVAWEDLPDATREANRRAAAALPVLLARAGFEAVQRERNAAII
jgi:hypothetical protein